MRFLLAYISCALWALSSSMSFAEGVDIIPIVLETSRERVLLNDDGTIGSIEDKKLGDGVHFRQDKWRGPQFSGVTMELEGDGKLEEYKKAVVSEIKFRGEKDGLSYEIAYSTEGDRFVCKTVVENVADAVRMVDRERLILGLDTYMEKFPQWNEVMFPTLLRSERSHFWGYFMSPAGRVLGIASPDKVASWAYNYEQSPTMKKVTDKAFFGAHRIFTVSLDVLHQLPLPTRHPQDRYKLDPKERVETSFILGFLDNEQAVAPFVAKHCVAPMLKADYYTLEEGKTFSGEIFGKDVSVQVKSPRHQIETMILTPAEEGVSTWTMTPESGPGLYTCMLSNKEGRVSEAYLYVRPKPDFYLGGARDEALRSQPTDTHHAECFYPLYTYFLARRYIPNQEVDARCEEVFQRIFSVLYDPEKEKMRNGTERIQDTATMSGILADRYRVTGDIQDLEIAAKLVEFLISCQKEDGAYYHPTHNVHYTSVIYLAKSIMEVMVEEKKLAETDAVWKERYARHLTSVRKAVDNLQEKGDDIQTEGQMTFEDGMISCSVTQLAFAAIKETDEGRKERYKARAIQLANKHECLTQSIVPDCRLNGATLRFWEYQYTVNMMINGMNSPCGWSAWKIYGSWYLYLMTGEYKYFNHVWNALGACMQLLDKDTKELRFGFIQDPYVDTVQYLEVPRGSGKPEVRPILMGEEYVAQTSSWHKRPNATWRTKWGIDNFPHEVYKCMAEVAWENAYLLEKEDGSYEVFRCHVEKTGDKLILHPEDENVKRLHVNLKKPVDIETRFGSSELYPQIEGLRWLGSIPDDLTPF